MKLKNAVKILCGVFCLTAVLALSGADVKAAGSVDVSPNGELTFKKVDDINVYDEGIINNLSIDTKNFNLKSGNSYFYKLNLDEDSLIKIEMRADGVTAYDKDAASGTWKEAQGDPSISFTIYRDELGWDPVSNPYTAIGSTKAETGNAIALDKQVYYIAINVADPSCTVTDSRYSSGKVQMKINRQVINSDEKQRPSSSANRNHVDIGKEYNSLLTATNPKDYFEFTLKKRAMVKFECKYNATEYSGASYNDTYFTLFKTGKGGKEEKLYQDKYSGDRAWYSKEKFLEKGTYYYTLETVTSYQNGAKDFNDGGAVQFKITTTNYNLTLKQVGKKTNSCVKVNTIDNAKEIRMVRGKLNNSELSSPKWNAAAVITDERQFGVNKAGYYTVRVTDAYDNMFMKSIKIKTCDKKAPGRPTVYTVKSGAVKVSGKAEKGSTVTVLVGTTPYTCKANSKGTFSCNVGNMLPAGTLVQVTATDISGNVSKTATVSVK